MTEAEILETLQQATAAAVAASEMPDLPIKFLTLSFDVPSDQKYIELVQIPNNQTGGFWGAEKNYQGMFRLILHWPNDGSGAYEPITVLGSINSYFSKDRRLGRLKITEPPDYNGVLEQGSENLYPASLRYQRFA